VLQRVDETQVHCHRAVAKREFSSQRLVSVSVQSVKALATYPQVFEQSLFQHDQLWSQLEHHESQYNQALATFIRKEFHQLQVQLTELSTSHQHDLVDLATSLPDGHDEVKRLKTADQLSHACLFTARQQLEHTQAQLQCLESMDRNLDSLPWRQGQEEVCQ
jgi:hypothetical protein